MQKNVYDSAPSHGKTRKISFSKKYADGINRLVQFIFQDAVSICKKQSSLVTTKQWSNRPNIKI